MRIVLAKMGLDGHDKGIKIIARALQDAGMEVTYLGLRQSAERIVSVAIEERADVIGISLLTGTHLSFAKELIRQIKEKGIMPKVIFGGTIGEDDIPVLKKLGVDYVYGVETTLEEILKEFSSELNIELIKNRLDLSVLNEKETSNEVKTASGIPVDIYYDMENMYLGDDYVLGKPGEYPYTRGPYQTMYRGRVWTMRQYAGMGTAIESNQRYKYLLERGQNGLSVALDLPTQIGYDSDHPVIKDEVGKVGVAIDTVEDMHTLFEGIPLDTVSVNFTINSTAIIILAMFIVMAEERGYKREILSGTVQNDMIKEFLSRNTYIFPLEPSLRIAGDIISFACKELPKFNPVSCSGYHIRELGADAVQELAFTLGAGITYVEIVKKTGIEVDQFAPRISFHLCCSQDLFEEVSKFRAARRIWAKIMKERFDAQNEKSYKFRVFAGGNGISLTAREPLNNIIRGTYQCLIGALGGAQTIHVPAYDEAYAIPTAESALLCLRTQQITAHETGIINTVDPLAGSYYVEYLTSELEKRATELLEEIDRRGGMVECIKSGWIQRGVIDSAYRTQLSKDDGKKIIVGVNKFVSETDPETKVVKEKVSGQVISNQIKRLNDVKNKRDDSLVQSTLENIVTVARNEENLFPSIIDAVRKRATLGEIVSAIKEVYGEYNGNNLF